MVKLLVSKMETLLAVNNMFDDAFLELESGKLYTLDLHGKTLEEARAELIYTLNSLDIFYKGVLVIHGYHGGTVLKNFVRDQFEYKNIYKKIKVDASRTVILIDWSTNEK